MRLKVEVKSPLSALCILLAAHWSHFDHDSYLSRKFSISSYGCPVVRPSLICPNPFRYHRFDCESVTSFHYSDSFVFGIVWYIRSTVEKFVDTLIIQKDLILIPYIIIIKLCSCLKNSDNQACLKTAY